MTIANYFMRRTRSWWLTAWPCWALIVFAGLALVRLLPGGFVRTAATAPILLIVPGALTLGAVLGGGRRRSEGVNFTCFAALLSVLWSAFASLALYVLHVLITATSTYWCLLAVCAILAVTAQTRLLLGRPNTGYRAAPCVRATDANGSDASAMPDASDFPDTGVEDANPAGMLGRTGHIVAAVVAGGSLLAGGTFAYLHIPHPAPAGYTWLAWARSPVKGDILVGSAGVRLPFEILH